MGTIRKINDDYYIEFEARGLKYQQKAGPDETTARKMLAEVEEKIRRGRMEYTVREADLAVFFDDFRSFAVKEHPARTRKRFESVIQHFSDFLERYPGKADTVSRVTPRVIEDYRAFLTASKTSLGRPLKPGVVNLTLFLLRDILEYAITCGHIHDNPALHVRRIPRLAALKPGIVSEEIFDALGKKASRQTAEATVFLRLTGLRFAEWKDLAWGDIDFENNRIVLSRHDAVRFPGRNRSIPLVPDARAILTSWKIASGRQGRVSESCGQNFESAAELERAINDAAGNSDAGAVTLRAIRNTFARDVLGKGVSLVRLARLMGYGDVIRAWRYSGLIKEGRHAV